MTTAAIRPYRISVPDAVLEDLRERIARARRPGEVEDAGWDYGADLAYLRRLVAYWRDGFDWRAAEAALNRMPQFTAHVRGHELHFVHARGRGPAPLPLVFSHGWPGSFWEVHKILGPLTDPAAHGGDPADAFHVVAPSLPGYGFSPDPRRRGVHPGDVAELFASLMTGTLGYPRYGAQGGDWGAVITSHLGRAHPEAVAGIHVNMLGARPDLGEGARPLTEAEQTFLREVEAWQRDEAGYQRIQGTKPQTLAYALTDSPVGLAAWIVEKFRAWSDCGGDVERRFTKDELLTNLTIYWVSGCIGSSVRLYYEAARSGWMTRVRPDERIGVPAGFARFPAEITRPPREWVERVYDIHRWSEFPRGGHFAALEEPELLVDDIRAFFRRLRRP